MPPLSPVLLLYCVPALAFAGLSFALFRSAIARVAACGLGLAACVLVYGGHVAAGALWEFFTWRFEILALALGLLVASIGLAPLLLSHLLQRPLWARLAVAAAALASVVLIATESTGRVPGPWGSQLSLWPFLPVVGLFLAGNAVAALHLSSGLFGALGAVGRRSSLVALAIGGPAAVSALLGPILFGTRLLPVLALLGGVGALYGAVALAEPKTPERLHAALVRAGAGAFVLATIFVSQAMASHLESRTRDVKAGAVIRALEEFSRVHGEYPDDLRELVPDFLPEVPTARIGLLPGPNDQFHYRSFGSSFALSFSARRWSDCTYTTPFVDEGHSFGAWNCRD